MNDLARFPQIVLRIIKEQEAVIGPLAWDEARKVQGIVVVDQKRGEINLQNGDTKEIIDKLVNQYERLFGRASREVCREAVQDLIAEMPPEEIPSSLK
ncbi:MAG: hypothetical protein A2639_01755 [Candidatus Staskawiczbacteria bacterium RIFCSPHIGHO2_01_FULL_34_27]|uniref:Uncharacterized protein n=2 Tax=Candidatus Staskawicziibacteriota TaxID=1817916 RepID=A0A1G2HLH3_9BACT|nr:MAG: hypothetical protein UR31_C0011G0005 [Parcubacteria group bacterium GW2011_GWA2_33_14]OGZ63374.1 MAG: hypothetical protein A2639_01755 [Candidatus Staskawiczbacteria bacterium RIFCSPHIGHO2_01_FULL_34_27]OGZ65857.1 MAG: hypothetical protein A3D34_03365 [Candidatus Staskawiczbacteria bacterium RIFCSPHIGHO2_02_FULL_33_16]OGZ70513.1 MAG: hypothetical protein A2980_01005 [Candidatus Staskawiczbacteria bacterium RIFCSPLOWO2_01_FULL_33_13]